MKSSMVEFSTDNKETLNRMAKKIQFQGVQYCFLSIGRKEVGRSNDLLCYNGYKIQEIQ
mgnify:CR=1 FL=1